MASSSFSISASIPISARRLQLSFSSENHFFLLHSAPPISLRRIRSPLRSSEPQEKLTAVVPETRAWVADLGGEDSGEEDGEDDEVEEEQDQSLDLLFRFLQNAFGKMSRRIRKAARSVLPPFIPTKLVRFAVNGVMILAFLWILKAFIELIGGTTTYTFCSWISRLARMIQVICTVGSVVFTSILLVRMTWSFSCVMGNQLNYASRIDNGDSRWSGAGAA